MDHGIALSQFCEGCKPPLETSLKISTIANERSSVYHETIDIHSTSGGIPTPKKFFQSPKPPNMQLKLPLTPFTNHQFQSFSENYDAHSSNVRCDQTSSSDDILPPTRNCVVVSETIVASPETIQDSDYWNTGICVDSDYENPNEESDDSLLGSLRIGNLSVATCESVNENPFPRNHINRRMIDRRHLRFHNQPNENPPIRDSYSCSQISRNSASSNKENSAPDLEKVNFDAKRNLIESQMSEANELTSNTKVLSITSDFHSNMEFSMDAVSQKAFTSIVPPSPSRAVPSDSEDSMSESDFQACTPQKTNSRKFSKYVVPPSPSMVPTDCEDAMSETESTPCTEKKARPRKIQQYVAPPSPSKVIPSGVENEMSESDSQPSTPEKIDFKKMPESVVPPSPSMLIPSDSEYLVSGNDTDSPTSTPEKMDSKIMSTSLVPPSQSMKTFSEREASIIENGSVASGTSEQTKLKKAKDFTVHSSSFKMDTSPFSYAPRKDKQKEYTASTSSREEKYAGKKAAAKKVTSPATNLNKQLSSQMSVESWESAHFSDSSSTSVPDSEDMEENPAKMSVDSDRNHSPVDKNSEHDAPDMNSSPESLRSNKKEDVDKMPEKIFPSQLTRVGETEAKEDDDNSSSAESQENPMLLSPDWRSECCQESVTSSPSTRKSVQVADHSFCSTTSSPGINLMEILSQLESEYDNGDDNAMEMDSPPLKISEKPKLSTIIEVEEKTMSFEHARQCSRTSLNPGSPAGVSDVSSHTDMSFFSSVVSPSKRYVEKIPEALLGTINKEKPEVKKLSFPISPYPTDDSDLDIYSDEEVAKQNAESSNGSKKKRRSRKIVGEGRPKNMKKKLPSEDSRNSFHSVTQDSSSSDEDTKHEPKKKAFIRRRDRRRLRMEKQVLFEPVPDVIQNVLPVVRAVIVPKTPTRTPCYAGALQKQTERVTDDDFVDPYDMAKSDDFREYFRKLRSQPARAKRTYTRYLFIFS